MKRREFIAGLGSAAVWPVTAHAQQRPRPVVGFLGVSAPSTEKPRIDAFLQRFGELGWRDGQNVVVEFRWAEGRKERYAEIASEFAKLRVDIVVTAGAAAVSAVKAVTSAIPIVFAIASDPVGTGIVDSLSRPGGNVTGLSYLGPDLAAKRLEFAREMISGMRVIGIMANTGAPGPVVELREVRAAAGSLGFEPITLEIQKAADIASAIEKLQKGAALYVCADPLVVTNRRRIIASALEGGIPTIFGEREFVDAEGLFSYGPSLQSMYSRAAELADKILRGVSPKDIPVEQPTKFELVINLKTARVLGLTVAPSLLARADEVIE
jgi:putative tryptophan/tyrosine transport system substrate-binding protein